MPLIRMTMLLAVFCTVCAPPIFAQTVDDEAAEHASASTEEGAHEGAHDFHRNIVSIFTGITHGGRRDNGLALGVGYERRLNKTFSIGVLAEHTFGDFDFTVYAVPFAYRVDRWKFLVAPGVEDGDHGAESLVRLGAEYAFEFDSWEMAPQVAVDFVDGDEVFIIGVVFGKGF